MDLHKRVIDPGFWSDTEIIEALPFIGRVFYQGIIQAAEDSGCVEDNPMSFKIHLFPADDVTKDEIAGWIETLVGLGKIIRYQSGGKPYLFLKNFFKHQKLRSPAPPKDAPLPPWLRWVPGTASEEGKRPGPGRYEVVVIDEYMCFLEHLCDHIRFVEGSCKQISNRTKSVRSVYEDDTNIVPQPKEENRKRKEEKGSKVPADPSAQPPQTELFEYFISRWQGVYNKTEDRPPGTKQDFVSLAGLVKSYGLEKCKKLVDTYLSISDDKFFGGHPLSVFYTSSTITRLLAIVNGGKNGSGKRHNGTGQGGLGGSGRFTPPAPREAFTHTGVVENW